MPTRKIAELSPHERCRDPEHNVPSHQVFENGVWEHTCPSCGHVTVFRVNHPTFSESVRPQATGVWECFNCGGFHGYGLSCPQSR